MKLSAVILTKNEEEFLPLSVSAIKDGVDELIIVDTGSSDGTVSIARDLVSSCSKIKLVEQPEDFSNTKESQVRQAAIALSSGDWVMPLDADEILSDGWEPHVRELMSDARYDGVRFRFEHIVGSYEYIHIGFKEKQKNPALHPDVSLHIARLYRRTSTLQCKPASEVNPIFQDQYHGSFDRSVDPNRYANLDSVTLFHYGFAKRDMMRMSHYRISRGDHGHSPERKAELVNALAVSGNPFQFVGPVCRVDYGPEFIPSVMRDKWDATYKLDLDGSGFIMERTLIATGEKC